MLKNCQILDCDRPYHGKGFCEPHYQEYRKANAPDCINEGCSKPARSRQMCNGHYSAWLIAANEKNVIDYDDYWEFVKKQLKIGDKNVA